MGPILAIVIVRAESQVIRVKMNSSGPSMRAPAAQMALSDSRRLDQKKLGTGSKGVGTG